MDDAIRFVGVFIACLIGPALLGWGLLWFVSQFWMYLLATATLVGLVLGLVWGGWWLATRARADRL